MACSSCPEDGHLPGCELLLLLTVKYGDSGRGIKGIAELSGGGGYLSDNAAAACDRWYERLHDMWVSEKRMYLEPSECGWCDEYA